MFQTTNQFRILGLLGQNLFSLGADFEREESIEKLNRGKRKNISGFPKFNNNQLDNLSASWSHCMWTLYCTGCTHPAEKWDGSSWKPLKTNISTWDPLTQTYYEQCFSFGGISLHRSFGGLPLLVLRAAEDFSCSKQWGGGALLCLVSFWISV